MYNNPHLKYVLPKKIIDLNVIEILRKCIESNNISFSKHITEDPDDEEGNVVYNISTLRFGKRYLVNKNTIKNINSNTTTTKIWFEDLEGMVEPILVTHNKLIKVFSIVIEALDVTNQLKSSLLKNLY